jgi:hypothetical protein
LEKNTIQIERREGIPGTGILCKSQIAKINIWVGRKIP